VTDHLGEALEYVYDSSDATDRRLIELTTGYGGTPIMSKTQAAAKLGISTAQVTRRTARIGEKLNEMENDIQQSF